ncbi:MAG: 2-hydroxyacid dehydrogenase, partial [Candidatus Ranarchaeia archaeon]
MEKPSVFVTRELLEPGLSILNDNCKVEVWPDAMPPPKSVIIEKAKQVDALIPFLTDTIDGEVISACERVKVISQVAVGYNNIDVDAATKHGIVVTNTPGVLTETTADFTFALLLASARRVAEADRYVRQGKWKVPWSLTMMLGQDIHNRTIGIVGLGRIGQAVARRARGFNMRIIYYDVIPRPEAEKDLGAEKVSIDQLLKEADFVTLHTPLTKETKGL